jgi:alpha-tubulin suppressor-like RCC1 family protein
MARSGKPLSLAGAVAVAAVVALTLTGCVADPPPIMGTAVGGNNKATVSWQAPLSALAPITAYVVTPWIGQVRQTPVRFNSTATTQTITGLTNGTTYTFTMVAISALNNDSATSASSNPVTPSPPIATVIATGDSHSCAIVDGGAIDCWGANSLGQLGNGSMTDSSTAVGVTGVTGATAIAGGLSRTCAIVAGGAVVCWGANSSTPVAVSGVTGATAITVGQDDHTCAIVAGGAVGCWGANGSGQLGNGTTTDSSTPVAVSGLTGATAIAAGESHTCAVVADGSAWCWGSDGEGQLGNGMILTWSSTPVAVNGVTGATAIATGNVHSCAVVAGGSALCWGRGLSGQLGNGSMRDSSTPVAVIGVTGATAIVGGNVYTCALVTGGTVHCWGANGAGQSNGFTGATAVDAGGAHTCAIAAAGAVDCWGLNNAGQLGNGTTTNSGTPVTVVWP